MRKLSIFEKIGPYMTQIAGFHLIAAMVLRSLTHKDDMLTNSRSRILAH
jgi:hypothetical protein